MEKTRAAAAEGGGRGRTRGECEREPQSACPPRDAEGLISACAAFTLSYHPLFPFPPLLWGNASLSYQLPHAPRVIIPSSRRLPSLPLPSVFPSSFSSFVRPSRVCVSLSLLSTFPLFPLGGLGFFPRLASLLSSSSDSVYRFLPFFLSLVGQFHPLSIRAAHCSRVSRIAEVKPSDDFLAGTWFRALLFSSPSLRVSFPCLLSS